MAQASSQWQQLVNLIQGLNSHQWHQGVLKQVSPQKLRGSRSWVWGLTVAIALLIWNWKLLIATSAGVLVMWGVYSMQGWDWQVVRSNLRRFLRSSNRQIAIAVCTGGIATVSSYMAVAIWAQSENHWLATGAILQGVATIATLMLVVWQMITPKASTDEVSFNELLINLTDTDPLKRLIAVRQITRLMKTTAIADPATISDYFRFMLGREREPMVREALLDGLQAVEKPQQLGKGPEPLAVATVKKRTAVKVRRPIYEYEE